MVRATRPLESTMSENESVATNKPLNGVRILVGRAKHQAGALSAQLREQGANVIEIPFIEIRKPRSFKPLDQALKNVNTYDWLILTSVNGVEAMWKRVGQLHLSLAAKQGRHEGNIVASSNEGRLRIAAIGPATRKAIEQRGYTVDVVPKEYVAESVVRSLKSKVKGRRVLLVRAKVARDVIPRELRKAGAHVDVVEAYETVVPQSSKRKLQAALKNKSKRPHVVTFTSSSTVKNFVSLIGKAGRDLSGIRMASIGPVTSATLRDCGLKVDIGAKEFTIPGLVSSIADSLARKPLEQDT